MFSLARLDYRPELMGRSMKNEKYYETRIKCDVLNFLRKNNAVDSRSIIASEYVLGSTGRRADLAAYNNAKFIGIEIKSQHDSLARLKDQLDVYASCFDEVMLVVDERHVDNALNVTPDHVTVFEARRTGAIEVCRAATVTSVAVNEMRLRLLTVVELKKLLSIPSATPAKKTFLLAQGLSLPDEVIRTAIIDSFSQAFSVTSSHFWESVRRKNVSLSALGLLSRYASRRASFREKEEKEYIFWESWRKDAAAAFQGIGA